MIGPGRITAPSGRHSTWRSSARCVSTRRQPTGAKTWPPIFRRSRSQRDDRRSHQDGAPLILVPELPTPAKAAARSGPRRTRRQSAAPTRSATSAAVFGASGTRHARKSDRRPARLERWSGTVGGWMLWKRGGTLTPPRRTTGRMASRVVIGVALVWSTSCQSSLAPGQCRNGVDGQGRGPSSHCHFHARHQGRICGARRASNETGYRGVGHARCHDRDAVEHLRSSHRYLYRTRTSARARPVKLMSLRHMPTKVLGPGPTRYSWRHPRDDGEAGRRSGRRDGGVQAHCRRWASRSSPSGRCSALSDQCVRCMHTVPVFGRRSGHERARQAISRAEGVAPAQEKAVCKT